MGKGTWIMKRVLYVWTWVLLLGAPTLGEQAGPVAHWAFDEGSGAVLTDRSGHGNDGMIRGAKWVANGEGHALEFDGTDDFVDCGAGASLDLRDTISIMAWVHPAGLLPSGEAGIAGKKYGSYVVTQAKGSVYMYITGGPRYVRTQWRVGGWRHVAAVYDGKLMRLYVDGRLVGMKPNERAIGEGGHFWLGRSDGTVEYTENAHFRGKMTEIRVYDRPLTPEEILRHFRTTNITNALVAAATPIPRLGKLYLDVDTRGLGPGRGDVTIHVEVHAQDSSGESAGPALLEGSSGRRHGADETSVVLPAESLQTGKYLAQVVATDGGGQRIGQPATISFEWVRGRPFPRGPVGARKLNNLVTELLNVDGPDGTGKQYSFVNPRRGWIFVSNEGGNEATLTGPGAAEALSLPLNEEHAGAHETMRYLNAGTYTISTPSARRLIVRAIPELHYAYYNFNPLVTEFGKFEGAFQEEHVFKNINTLCRDVDAAAKAWSRRGKRWLGHTSFVRWPKEQQSSAEAIYDHLTQEPGFTNPDYAGIVVNEFGDSAPECAAWAEAVDRILSDERFKGRGFYPYAGDLSNGPEGRALVQVLVKHGGAILCERYLKEQRTVVEAWRYMRARLVEPANAYRENCPGSIPHLVINFGIFTGPPEALDTFPHVSHKTYLDMQFNMVATDPAFEDLGGIMSYSSGYSDEETVRWVMRMFRHYAIEGNTDALGRDPYILTHLRNGDFERAGEGWVLRPADEGSIRFGTRLGFGWMQGRYPRTSEGDTVLIAKRHEDGPNVFSQQIGELQPGRLYSLRMFTGDYHDMSTKGNHAVSIRLDDATMVPEKSFTHLFHNHRVHRYAPYDGEQSKAWMNYHWRVFRAKTTTATLSISDWANEKGPGGPIGRELMFNFVQVQPYFPE